MRAEEHNYVEGTTDEVMDGWAGYKHAYTENLKFWYVAESSTVVAGLQTGQYDVAGIASENISTVKSAGLSVASKQGDSRYNRGGRPCMLYKCHRG